MPLFDAVVLGVVQGLTEFIPVSSSGHLILVREVLGIPLAGSLAFDVMLHFATALAIVAYFWRDIWNMFQNWREEQVLWAALIIGTIPAVVLGLLYGSSITDVTRTPSVVAWALIGGSVLFVFAELLGTQGKQITKKGGLLVGLYQTLAFIPGVSRSGATISGGMLYGLNREAATRFAFLLGIPILLGVGVVKLFELIGAGGIGGEGGLALLVGSVVAFGVGLLSIHWMLKFLRSHTLYSFALYRVLLAVLVFLFL